MFNYISREFVSAHLQNSSSLSTIFRLHRSFYISKLPTLQNCREIVIPSRSHQNLDDLHTLIIGSCMGILCLLDGPGIIFINIYTKRQWMVTFPSVLDAGANPTLSLYGFGMVDQTCYKFLWIRCVYDLTENTAYCEVSLYTSNTDA
jgi:hypothetical protein